jgi:hypothetical protein
LGGDAGLADLELDLRVGEEGNLPRVAGEDVPGEGRGYMPERRPDAPPAERLAPDVEEVAEVPG